MFQLALTIDDFTIQAQFDVGWIGPGTVTVPALDTAITRQADATPICGGKYTVEFTE